QGEVELAVTRAEQERGVLTARLLDRSGEARATWSSATRRLAPDGVTRFALRAPGLPRGEYQLVAEFNAEAHGRGRAVFFSFEHSSWGTEVGLGPAPPPEQPAPAPQPTPMRAEQPWWVIPRRQAAVTLNRDGYLEQDGQAIFPLGLFNGGARMEEAAA